MLLAIAGRHWRYIHVEPHWHWLTKVRQAFFIPLKGLKSFAGGDFGVVNLLIDIERMSENNMLQVAEKPVRKR